MKTGLKGNHLLTIYLHTIFKAPCIRPHGSRFLMKDYEVEHNKLEQSRLKRRKSDKKRGNY